MSSRTVWCPYSYRPTSECGGHTPGHPHSDVVSDLGRDDEPRRNGPMVLAWPGDYRVQLVWVASGENIGTWHCLGNEFGRPQPWDPPAVSYQAIYRREVPARPAGTIPAHPTWSDVLASGPVSLLDIGERAAYADGWRNGRRRLLDEIASIADDDSGAYDS